MFIPARWRYLWLFFVVLVCALVFRLAFVDRLNELKQPYEIRQGALIDQAALLINTRLSLVETQIRLFRHELELLNPTQAELEPAMISMFKLYSDTLQVRWIDEQGFEQVRLNKTADNNVGVVLTDELQNKRNRYYVEAGLALADGPVEARSSCGGGCQHHSNTRSCLLRESVRVNQRKRSASLG